MLSTQISPNFSNARLNYTPYNIAVNVCLSGLDITNSQSSSHSSSRQASSTGRSNLSAICSICSGASSKTPTKNWYTMEAFWFITPIRQGGPSTNTGLLYVKDMPKDAATTATSSILVVSQSSASHMPFFGEASSWAKLRDSHSSCFGEMILAWSLGVVPSTTETLYAQNHQNLLTPFHCQDWL